MAIRTSGNVQSVEEVVALTEEPKIAKLKKTGGDVPTYNTIRLLLVGMSNNLHIDNGLTEQNINNIARRLTTDGEITWWLTLADIDLLCRRIVNGEFGRFYGHFSEGEFYDCMVKYCNERREIHFLQNDKVVKPDTSIIDDVGCSIDKHGRVVVPKEVQEKKLPPPLYIYDNAGHRRENPEAWKKVRGADTERQNKVLAFAKILMAEDKTLDIKDAIERAANSIEKQPPNQ